MWICSKCQESVEDSFDLCWSCGTSKDGTEDPEFQAVKDVAAETESSMDELATAAYQSPQAEEVVCDYCGANEFKMNVCLSNTHDAHAVGLAYRDPELASGCEPLCADLCLGCGTIQRIHVQETNREWLTNLGQGW
ncbi:MAG: hypothetical protein P8L85_09985 [Rubripirellula sp.]|nr:hypothetical protein [Rubripirellula sp.]